ncbi:MAG: cell division ATP-binding protein FtsE [Candidatus Wallbacteria bacterium HGW-Wallbacteria-1]|jgi:cell division transport system ATP-binding protein|uniref:Cell division ATP-binding protein FtsE n=1 Tax=Candidatus Wallbacteria bacterium HGW-Wallbacteria-1 TaxID=2013854 RepID=A0A2N1PU87_9BACT|nr:MAG: cell division ATP-binding protein FtsE [Candidatus Wallbacteria bacterium HGW-Wallbacteria-1]
MIQMYNVTKIYDNGVKALDNLNVEIEKGEFVFLVGPSGAGKTSFMRLIFREELPTQGHVIIDGRNIERLVDYKVPYLRRNVGVVFQDFKLLKNRTILENVAFALRVTDVPEDHIQSKSMRALEMVGLSGKRSMTPTQLSGGEQQRVCIARALVNDPAILLADEPTGNLDPKISWEIMRALLEINMRGTTIIVATHDKAVVDRMRKRVIALVNGQIAKDHVRGIYDYEGIDQA